MPADKEDFKEEIRNKRVFIAAVSTQMAQFKENLINELKQHGYFVGQADVQKENISSIPLILDQFDVAIHLLSDKEESMTSNGIGIEEQQISYTVQHYLNQKLISDSNEEIFHVFAWHPKSVSESIFEEEHLPRHLHKIQQMEEVELLRTNFEDFKYYLLKKLEQTTAPALDSDHYIKGDRNLNLYFLYDSADTISAQNYMMYLNKRGYTVLKPQFDGDIMNIRQMHNNCLKNLDLAIIFAHQASVNWVNMKIMDILKSPGLGREKEILGKAIFMPEDKVKMCPLAARGFDIIPFDEDLSEDQLDDFLNKKLL